MGKPKGESRGLKYLQEVRPEALSHLLSFFKESGRHLEPKTRFLISIVTKVISQSSRGLEQYVRRALDEGATPNEILDAVLCAYPCAGLTKVVDALDTILDLGLPGFSAGELQEGDPASSSAAAGDGAGLREVEIDGRPGDWYEAAPVAHFAGDARARLVGGGHDVAVFRSGDAYFALGNRCPHAGAPLSEGHVRDGVIVCPLHAWRFDLATGQSPDVPAASVPRYAVKVEAGRVFVRIP